MKREAYILTANSNLTTYLFKIIKLTQTLRESLIQINLKKELDIYSGKSITNIITNIYTFERNLLRDTISNFLPASKKKTNLFNESTDLIQNTRISRRTREIGRNWNVPLPPSPSENGGFRAETRELASRGWYAGT